MPEPEVFYIESLGNLYKDVQTQKIFPDSKYFVDCIPAIEVTALLSLYEKAKAAADFDLKKFVTEHFIFPIDFVSIYRSGNKPILQHLDELWAELTRKPQSVKGGTLIPLPHPYVVPGGRFREIYYWDSYFTMLGLQVSKKTDTLQQMVNNFSYLIDTFGFIPNGNRTYYLSRSQPPFFTLMVELLAEELGEKILLQYLPQLEKEYDFWMEGATQLTADAPAYRHVVRLTDGSILNRYCDTKNTARPEAFREDSNVAGRSSNPELAHMHLRAACESGWDFSSRWCRDEKEMGTIQAAHIIPVDLNCLLLRTEELIQHIYELNNDSAKVNLFEGKIKARKNALLHYCWNQEAGFYFDYHFVDDRMSDVYTLAAAFPLFFKVASQEQAAAVAKQLQEKFLQPGGLVTTLNHTGQQWDAPNGWAPLQWMAYKGLQNYGHSDLAGVIKQRWMATNEKFYLQSGKMMEKYNVMDTSTTAKGGEYANQDGFGWTNGVYLKLQQEK